MVDASQQYRVNIILALNIYYSLFGATRAVSGAEHIELIDNLCYAQELHLLHGLLHANVGLWHASHQPLHYSYRI